MLRLPTRLVLLAGAVLLSVGVVAASGLTALTIDRTVGAEVVADNSTAAVKIECLDNSGSGGLNYQPVCEYSAGGVVTLKLHKALGTGATGFNPSASFTVGDQAGGKRVLKLTNNSGIGIKVWLDDGTNRIKMYNQSGGLVNSSASAQVIAPGTSHAFYFTVDTPPTTGTLSATLRIRKQ